MHLDKHISELLSTVYIIILNFQWDMITLTLVGIACPNSNIKYCHPANVTVALKVTNDSVLHGCAQLRLEWLIDLWPCNITKVFFKGILIKCQEECDTATGCSVRRQMTHIWFIHCAWNESYEECSIFVLHRQLG